MSFHLIPRQLALSEDRFIGDLANVFKFHNIRFGKREDLDHLGPDLVANGAFRSQLFRLCNAISHMAEADLSPEELLVLVARAMAGPGVSDSQGTIDIPRSTRSAFLVGFKAWNRGESATEETSAWPPDRSAKLTDSRPTPKPTADLADEEDLKPHLVPPSKDPVPERPASETSAPAAASSLHATLGQLTLSELRAYLEDIERRMSRIEPHLEQISAAVQSSPESLTPPQPNKVDQAEKPRSMVAAEPEKRPSETPVTSTVGRFVAPPAAMPTWSSGPVVPAVTRFIPRPPSPSTLTPVASTPVASPSASPAAPASPSVAPPPSARPPELTVASAPDAVSSLPDSPATRADEPPALESTSTPPRHTPSPARTAAVAESLLVSKSQTGPVAPSVAIEEPVLSTPPIASPAADEKIVSSTPLTEPPAPAVEKPLLPSSAAPFTAQSTPAIEKPLPSDSDIPLLASAALAVEKPLPSKSATPPALSPAALPAATPATLAAVPPLEAATAPAVRPASASTQPVIARSLAAALAMPAATSRSTASRARFKPDVPLSSSSSRRSSPLILAQNDLASSSSELFSQTISPRSRSRRTAVIVLVVSLLLASVAAGLIAYINLHPESSFAIYSKSLFPSLAMSLFSPGKEAVPAPPTVIPSAAPGNAQPALFKPSPAMARLPVDPARPSRTPPILVKAQSLDDQVRSVPAGSNPANQPASTASQSSANVAASSTTARTATPDSASDTPSLTSASPAASDSRATQQQPPVVSSPPRVEEPIRVATAAAAPTPFPSGATSASRPADASIPAPIVRSPPAPTGPVTVPSSLLMANALFAPKPTYPTAAAHGMDGTVVVQASISKEGKVTSTRALSGPFELRFAALHAMQSWQFRPYLVSGKPIEVVTTLNFVFHAP